MIGTPIFFATLETTPRLFAQIRDRQISRGSDDFGAQQDHANMFTMSLQFRFINFLLGERYQVTPDLRFVRTIKSEIRSHAELRLYGEAS